MFGYKRAAAALFALDTPLTDLVDADGTWPRIPGIGPGSSRVIREVLETGGSPTVEQAIEQSDRRADIERRRQLRRHFLSRAEVRRVVSDPSFVGPTIEQYLGDLQMHSEWSDGFPTVQDIADACRERGYQYSAVTDHSYGLKIAGGMSMAEAVQQRQAIDDVNARSGNQFRLLQGIEANIDSAGQLVSPMMRRRPLTWYWPRRIRGYEGARIRPTACSPPSRTRPFGSWRTRAVGSPDRAPV